MVFRENNLWWLISDILPCRYLAHDIATLRQNGRHCDILSPVLSHCRYLVRFVALSLPHLFCRTCCTTNVYTLDAYAVAGKPTCDDMDVGCVVPVD